MVRTGNVSFLQLLKLNGKNSGTDNNEDINKFTNELIEKFNYNLEKFNYNVLIAKLYETYNYFSNIIKKDIAYKDLKENYVKVLTIMSPIIPHFASECLENLSITDQLKWPEVDKSKLKNDKINYVVQFNSKKKGNIVTKPNIERDELITLIKKDLKFKNYLVDKEILKVFFVENKLINILLK